MKDKEEEDLGYGSICPHCGEPLVWQDMFGQFWCSDLFWGPVEKKGE